MQGACRLLVRRCSLLSIITRARTSLGCKYYKVQREYTASRSITRGDNNATQPRDQAGIDQDFAVLYNYSDQSENEPETSNRAYINNTPSPWYRYCMFMVEKNDAQEVIGGFRSSIKMNQQMGAEEVSDIFFALKKYRQPKVLLNLYEEVSCAGPDYVNVCVDRLEIAMAAALRLRKVSWMEEYFGIFAEKFDLRPSVYVLMLKGFSFTGNMLMAHELLRQMSLAQSPPPSVECYEVVIKGYAARALPDVAGIEALIDDMLKADIDPTPKILSLLLRSTVLNGQFSKAEIVIKSLKEKNYLSDPSVTGEIFRYHMEKGDTDICHDMLSSAKKEPDNIPSLACMYESAIRHLHTKKNVHAAIQLYNNNLSREILEHKPILYILLMRIMLMNDRPDFFHKLWEDSKAQGIEPDPNIFSFQIRYLSRNLQSDPEMLKRFTNQAYKLDPSLDQGRDQDVIKQSELKVLKDHGYLYRKQLVGYEERPTRLTGQVLQLRYLFWNGNTAKGLACFADLCREYSIPDVRVFGMTILGLYKNDETAQASKVLQLQQRFGVSQPMWVTNGIFYFQAVNAIKAKSNGNLTGEEELELRQSIMADIYLFLERNMPRLNAVSYVMAGHLAGLLREFKSGYDIVLPLIKQIFVIAGKSELSLDGESMTKLIQICTNAKEYGMASNLMEVIISATTKPTNNLRPTVAMRLACWRAYSAANIAASPETAKLLRLCQLIRQKELKYRDFSRTRIAGFLEGWGSLADSEI